MHPSDGGGHLQSGIFYAMNRRRYLHIRHYKNISMSHQLSSARRRFQMTAVWQRRTCIEAGAQVAIRLYTNMANR